MIGVSGDDGEGQVGQSVCTSNEKQVVCVQTVRSVQHLEREEEQN